MGTPLGGGGELAVTAERGCQRAWQTQIPPPGPPGCGVVEGGVGVKGRRARGGHAGPRPPPPPAPAPSAGSRRSRGQVGPGSWGPRDPQCGARPCPRALHRRTRALLSLASPLGVRGAGCGGQGRGRERLQDRPPAGPAARPGGAGASRGRGHGARAPSSGWRGRGPPRAARAVPRPFTWDRGPRGARAEAQRRGQEQRRPRGAMGSRREAAGASGEAGEDAAAASREAGARGAGGGREARPRGGDVRPPRRRGGARLALFPGEQPAGERSARPPAPTRAPGPPV